MTIADPGTTSPATGPSAERFRDVIGRFASGVSVITTLADDVPYGTTVSALSSLSLEPPTLLICLNTESETGRAVSRSRCFAVNVLSACQAGLAAGFAVKGPAKFHGVATTSGRRRVPLLVGALATLECRVVDQVTAGTHVVFIGEVEAAAGTPGAPLTYFRGRMGGLAVEPSDQGRAVS